MNSTESGLHQEASAKGSDLTINIQGDLNSVCLDDPEVKRLLVELLKQREGLSSKNQIKLSQAEADALKRQLAEAVRTTVAASREPNPRTAAKAAVLGLENGDIRPIRVLLTEREHTAAESAQRGGTDAPEAALEAANMARQQGALLFEEDYHAALSAFERATRHDPNDFWAYCFIGNLQFNLGNTDMALQSFHRAAELRQEVLAARDPSNTEWQRDLSVIHDRIGDVLFILRDLAGALIAFQKCLALREALVACEPTNTLWQSDLSVILSRIGDVLLKQGDKIGSIFAFRKGLALSKELISYDPANTQWRRDHSMSQKSLGDALFKAISFHTAFPA